ncbi:hypothetical protein, conserved, partial [Babesia bigemina]
MKFDKILNLKITLNNNPTNILNNLCTGLETFLGFNSASKGYDGSGIVYSDLDRLCDGVMGFLYQVLKDVSEKQPYQVGRETYLKKVLGEISEQLLRGNSGFNIALPKILSRIGKYNADVQQYNDSVKKPTDTFLVRLKNDFPKEIKKIPNDKKLKEMSSHTVENAVAPTRELSSKYIQYGNDFDRALQKAKKEISNLNSQCKNNVTTAQKQVKYVTERLAALSTKEESDLKAVESEITETLNSLKDGVNVRVRRDVSELVKLLKDKVSAIWKLLEEIDKKLYEYVDALQKWIDKADKDVNQAISKSDGIEQKLPGGKNRDELNRISSELKTRSDVIWNYVEEMKKQIAENVKAALQQVKDMDGKLKEDLKRVKEGIKEAIKQLGKRMVKHVIRIGDVKEQIGEQLSPIVRTSKDMFADFGAVKNALDKALRNVSEDIRKLVNLEQLVDIKSRSSKTLDAPLLKAIAGDNPFKPLISYFENLNTKVMDPIRTVMTRVCDGLGRGFAAQGNNGLHATLIGIKEQLKGIHNVVKGSVPEMKDLKMQLTSILGDKLNVENLDLNSKPSHAQTIQTVAEKLERKTDKIDKTEAISLLTVLSDIAKTVSAHTQRVIEEVMHKIKEKNPRRDT